MTTLADLLTARPVDAADGPRLAEAYLKLDGPPRFWRAASYLASDNANRIIDVDGCVVLLRVKVLHARPVAYLVVPPLGRTVDVQRRVIRKCLDLGVGCMLTQHDMGVYGIDAAIQKDNTEHIYRGVPSGKRGQRHRTGRNRLDRLAVNGHVDLHSCDHLHPGLAEACVALADRWQQQRAADFAAGGTRTGKGVAKIVAAYARRVALRQHALVVTAHDGRAIAINLCESIGPRHVACVAAIRDYDDPLADQLTQALEAKQTAWWGARHWINMGAARALPGLTEHKDALHGEVVQLYRADPAVRLTLDDYRAATAAPQLTLEV